MADSQGCTGGYYNSCGQYIFPVNYFTRFCCPSMAIPPDAGPAPGNCGCTGSTGCIGCTGCTGCIGCSGCTGFTNL